MPVAMAAKANSQPRQWAKPSFMVNRDRLPLQAGIRKRPVKWGRSAGSVLRSQGSSGEEGLSRCARGIFGDRFQCSLRTDPAPLGVIVWALAGKLRGGWGFRAVREGFLVIASNARSGPIPLPLCAQQARSYCSEPPDQWVAVVRALLVGAEDGAGGFGLGLGVGLR